MSISDKLTTIAENEQKVYEAGRTQEWSDFWDIYQSRGSRRTYEHAFRGLFAGSVNGWDDSNFKPKYDIIASNLDHCFQYSSITNLKQILEDCGVSLSFSDSMIAAGLYYAFEQSRITHIPELYCPTVSNMQNAFRICRDLKSIDKITVSSGCSTLNAFQNCTALEEIRIGSVIANAWNFQWSTKLSKDSITSVINALSNTSSGLTVTFSKTAVNNAFKTAEGLSDGSNSSEWATLIETKPNWTISLV